MPKWSSGIIPTRVGTSQTNFSTSAYLEDHPHACGDKAAFMAVGTASEGSSPRVWGQAERGHDKKRRYRIIPTRVGTRGNYSVATNTGKDHPHACGDKRQLQCRYEHRQGSSPRVWGQVVFICCSPFRPGIIPTRVGTSETHKSERLERKDHPHACGDKCDYGKCGGDVIGSSPRVWGQDLVD